MGICTTSDGASQGARGGHRFANAQLLFVLYRQVERPVKSLGLRSRRQIVPKGIKGLSDFSQGSGWWLASDGKWYPPETKPTMQQPSVPLGSAASEGAAPPGDSVASLAGPRSAGARVGLWQRFRTWPKAVQVLSWIVAFFVVLGIIGAATGAGKKSSADLAATSRPTTTVASTTTSPPTTTPPTTSPPTTTPPTTTPPTTTPPTTTPPTTTPPTTTPSLTPSQQNAIRAAQQYLSMGTGFSRLGLIQQLSSPSGDGYPLADATYAVDSLSEDWNAQAALSAKNYLSTTSFSCSGLIQQLSSSAGDQFTLAQAQYGAKAAGIC